MGKNLIEDPKAEESIDGSANVKTNCACSLTDWYIQYFAQFFNARKEFILLEILNFHHAVVIAHHDQRQSIPDALLVHFHRLEDPLYTEGQYGSVDVDAVQQELLIQEIISAAGKESSIFRHNVGEDDPDQHCLAVRDREICGRLECMP